MFSTLLSRCTVSVARYTKSFTALRQLSSEINFADLVKKNKIVVFMKGSPDKPRCGYSRYVVHILRCHGVEFETYDVLSNNELRKGMKSFSDWPTFPQIYINGEFIGGCDILVDMHQDGSLIEKLKKIGIKSIVSTGKISQK